MRRALKVLLVFGTRPEAIKMAPVVRRLQADPDRFDARVCVTAQHRALLDQVLDLFDIRTHHDLDIMTPGQGLHQITTRVLEGLQGCLEGAAPDWILVHGDTTTTFAAALAAFYAQVPVGHVEAGLRTGRRYSPYPEEMNRRLTGALTTLHFAPTAAGRANLLREGVAPADIVVTGNTAIDALQLALASPRLAALPSEYRAGSRGILVTAHRRENFGPGIRSICRALRRIAADHPDAHLIYPVHPNPNILGPVREALGDVANVTLLEPVGYERAVRLMADARLILTDSGGIQEEAPSLGKPVLVLRESTERPEGLDAGTARLVGTDEGAIIAAVAELLGDGAAYERMARAVNPYGDGRAAERIAGALLARADGGVGVGETAEFAPPPV
ncbi:MAG: non-hydrolyzing UDP-N-acetylglucosamine 2-epimerase [Candidatus Krumholzibacteriia bacterium]